MDTSPSALRRNFFLHISIDNGTVVRYRVHTMYTYPIRLSHDNSGMQWRAPDSLIPAIAVGIISAIALVWIGDALRGTVVPAPSIVLPAIPTVPRSVGEGGAPSVPSAPSVIAITATTSFFYSFNADGILQEAGNMEESTSRYFWLDSGGKLPIKNGIGSTVIGELSALDKWRLAYLKSSAVDTDNGYHPQNLFRLIARVRGDNVRAESLFRIVKDNFSASPNRNASNGLLLMMRYQDYKTLYYAGVRVDGTAVIKKKYQGTYYTMAQKKIFSGTYAQGSAANLLPHNEWLSLRAETSTNADGSVVVRLFMKRSNESTWTKLLESRDASQYGGTPPITAAGYLGIRTDFMDVEFDSFRIGAI